MLKANKMRWTGNSFTAACLIEVIEGEWHVPSGPRGERTAQSKRKGLDCSKTAAFSHCHPFPVESYIAESDFHGNKGHFSARMF